MSLKRFCWFGKDQSPSGRRVGPEEEILHLTEVCTSNKPVRGRWVILGTAWALGNALEGKEGIMQIRNEERGGGSRTSPAKGKAN